MVNVPTACPVSMNEERQNQYCQKYRKKSKQQLAYRLEGNAGFVSKENKYHSSQMLSMTIITLILNIWNNLHEFSNKKAAIEIVFEISIAAFLFFWLQQQYFYGFYIIFDIPMLYFGHFKFEKLKGELHKIAYAECNDYCTNPYKAT